MVATGSRVGGKLAPGGVIQLRRSDELDGASSSFDEATNLTRLLSFSPYSPWSSAYGQ
jgi:hypothetical protein